MNEILEIRDVTKYYGGGSVVTKALDGISFGIEKGEFTAIMGASGSGKSTLLNVISTIDRVSAGEIRVDGKRLTGMKENELSVFRRDRLGFIFQDYNLLDTLTIGENIVLPLNLKKTDYEESRKELERVAKALSVADQLDKFPYELSGGQRQALTLLMATLVTPKLLLLDEHTAALDPGTAEKVLELTRTIISDHHITCLMVTHNMKQALELGNRTLMMADGQIVLDVSGQERAGMTVDDLLRRFKAGTGRDLDNDRILLSD